LTIFLRDESITFDNDLILTRVHIGKGISAVITGGDLIAATALRASGLSSLSILSSLSERSSTLTLLSASTGISGRTSLTCLTARILPTLRSSGCLAGQTTI
jgi:hypothetical protein